MGPGAEVGAEECVSNMDRVSVWEDEEAPRTMVVMGHNMHALDAPELYTQ